MEHYKPANLKTIIEAAGASLAGKTVLLINPPTVETVTWVGRSATVHTLHFSSNEVYQYIGNESDKAVPTAKRFTAVLLRSDPERYLSACAPQLYDLIIWFDAEKTPNAQQAFSMGKRATAFHGQQVVLTTQELVTGLPDVRQMEFTAADTVLHLHVWTKVPGFLIASYPRCGTHMLRTALGKHPEVNCYTEVFNPTVADGSHRLPSVQHVTEAFWTKPLDGILGHAYIGVPGGAAGMTAPRVYPNFWEALPRNIKLISMRRRDLLSRHVSYLKAKQTTVWNREGGKPGTNDHAVNVDVNKLYQDADFVRKCWRRVDTLYPNRLVVCYEDLLEDFQRELTRVQNYLNILAFDYTPDTHKLGRPLQQDIANYAAVMAEIKRRGEDSLHYEP